MTQPSIPHLRFTPIALALTIAGLVSLAHAAPQDGVVRAGAATISGGGAYTRIDQTTGRAVIDWRGFSIGSGEQVQFVQPSASSAILNRVTGSQVSTLLGRLDANGQVLLINPNGIVIGKGGQVNVGSFIASTSNISNHNFMNGRLIFDEAGKAGAGILNAGSITAAEGGLVALVAPHVRNDGLIQARLGKVMLGAADTFTIDLYGDQLVNLALSDAHVGQLKDASGQSVQSLITQAGKIESGQAVLVTAATARNVLDSLINMSGTIRAETATQDGGRIVLLGEGGKVNVSGTLDASGARGGQIDVLGQDITLTSPANLNASGVNGGGIIHVGGAYQGSGSTYRSQRTAIESGASLTANALTSGNGGEVVVWSDGNTAFAGNVEAKGGALSGNGGRLEVSGKGTLAFNGTADASAANGVSGSLLLDPAFFTIGAVEASQISTTLRTGTSVTLAADVDINLNSIVDGRSGVAGGGITMTAGNNINLNDHLLTNNGAIHLTATNGTINALAGKLVSAGTASIALIAGSNLSTGALLTSGALSLQSLNGAVSIDTALGNATGPLNINAATDVIINQPLLSIASGNALTVNAGTDITINAIIDGRSRAITGGTVNLVAGNNIHLNNSIVTLDGAINVTSTAGTALLASGVQLRAGAGPINITTAGDFSTGLLPPPIPAPATPPATEAEANNYRTAFVSQYATLITSGALTIHSTQGSVNVNTPVPDSTGAVTITAANAVNVNQKINTNNAPVTINAGAGGINVAANADGCGGSSLCADAPEIDSRLGNLTLNSVGNINIADLMGVTTGGILTIDTRGAIVQGAVGKSLGAIPVPQRIILTGDQGITFSVEPGESIGDLTATSLTGSIVLRAKAISGVTTINAACAACDVGFEAEKNLGTITTINAGGTVELGDTRGGSVALTAGLDAFVRYLDAAQLSVVAGNDIQLGKNKNETVWIRSGPLSLIAGNDIITTIDSPIRVANNQPTTMHAGGALSLYYIETLGAMDLKATTGNVTLATPLGAHMNKPDFNPLDLGIGSLTIAAPAISLQGVRAEGAVTITTGNLASTNAINSTNGPVSPATFINAPAVGTLNLLVELTPATSPAIPPGPTVSSPFAPDLASVPALLLPELLVTLPPTGAGTPPPVIFPPPPVIVPPSPGSTSPPPAGGAAPATSASSSPNVAAGTVPETRADPAASPTAVTSLAGLANSTTATDTNGDVLSGSKAGESLVFEGGHGVAQDTNRGHPVNFPTTTNSAVSGNANTIACPPGVAVGTSVLHATGFGAVQVLPCQ